MDDHPTATIDSRDCRGSLYPQEVNGTPMQRRAGLLALALIIIGPLAGCLDAGSDPTAEPTAEATAPGGAVSWTYEPTEQEPARGDGINTTRWDPETLTGYDWLTRPAGDYRDGSPYGVHLSFADDPKTTLTVTWFTYGSGDVDPVVEWSAPDSADVRTVPASTEKAFTGDWEDPNSLSDAYTHHATITGLAAGQTVAYRVNGTTGASPVYEARTDPGPGEAVRIMQWGDHGVVYDGSKNLTGFALENLPDLILIAGDVAYADGNQTKWDLYFWYYEPLFARVPMMASPGNHENKDGTYYEGFRTRFTFPGEETYYGFDFGATHITVLETEAATLLAPVTDDLAGPLEAGEAPDLPGAADDSQRAADFLAFIEGDYRQTQARKEAGEVAFGMTLQHSPPYSNHDTRGDNCLQILILEPFWQQYDADLILTGHNHHYERSTPMAWDAPDDAGFVQIINGAGGKSLYDFLPPEQFASWSAAAARTFGVVDLLVSADRLQGTFYETAGDWAAHRDGSLHALDTFVMQPDIRTTQPVPTAEVLGNCLQQDI